MRRVCIWVGVLATVLIWVGIGWMARMSSAQQTSAAAFWDITTRVNLGGWKRSPTPVPTMSEMLIEFGRNYVYETPYVVCEQGGPYIWDSSTDQVVEGRVTLLPVPFFEQSEEELRAYLPRVKMELEPRAAAGYPDDWVATAYARWKVQDKTGERIDLFFELIEGARLERIVAAGLPTRSATIQREKLQMVIAARKLYWVCVLFEGVFLPGLVWFALWPFIQKRQVWRKLLHVGVVPLLFYLPHWFGYCNSLSRTFNIGGALYSYATYPNEYLGHRLERWEILFLDKLPQPFAGITQGRGNYDRQYVWAEPVGPVRVGLMTAAMIGTLGAWYGGVWLRRKWRERKEGQVRGFPVEDVGGGE